MYALFATNFHSVNRAMDFIYEKEEDIASGKFVMLHPFVGYEPENNNYVDDDGDEIDALEKILTPRKICLICNNNSDCHKEIASVNELEDENLIPEARVPNDNIVCEEFKEESKSVLPKCEEVDLPDIVLLKKISA